MRLRVYGADGFQTTETSGCHRLAPWLKGVTYLLPLLFHNTRLLLLPFLIFSFFFLFLPTHLSVGDVRMQPFSYLPFCQAHRKRLRFRLNHHFYTPCNFKAEKNWSCQKDFDVSVGRQMVSGFMKTASCRGGSPHTYELIQYEWFQQ